MMRNRVTSAAAITATAILVLSACASGAEPTTSTSATETMSSPVPTGAAATASEPATESPVEPTPDAVPAQGASDAYLDWLAASRLPDADTACAGLTQELIERMLAELRQSGTAIGDCEEMMTFTAELYRSLDQSADVDIAVQTETATDATLFVTYLASGDCGTVVMHREAASWIITEQSEECVN